MRVVVVGGTGHIGTLVVRRLQRAAQAVVVASPTTGVNALTGEGLPGAFELADVVIEVTSSSGRAGQVAEDFFVSSTRHILAAEREAGVGHHITLSIVGADGMSRSGYFAAKAAQERLIQADGIPYSILRSTQFFEFARAIADWNSTEDTIHLPSTEVQPVAAADVAKALTELAWIPPARRVLEVAGPERMTLPSFVGRVLLSDRDERFVVKDDDARTKGFNIEGTRLVPGEGSMVGSTSLESWIATHSDRSEVAV